MSKNSPTSGTSAGPTASAAGSDAASSSSGGVPLWATLLVYAVATLAIFSSFVFGGDMLFGGDTEGLGYMARAFYAEQLRDGNFPLWNPLLLGGTPFLESLAGGDSLYPLSAPLLLIMEPFRALGWKLVLHVMLAGVGMYGWARSIGAGKGAAFVGGLGYLVAPFMVTLVYPAHDGKIFVTALTPFLFWAVETYFVGGRGRAWAATAAIIALVTLTTHFQMAYFLFLATGIYAFFRAVQLFRDPSGMQTGGEPTPPRAAGRFGLFLVASLVGAGAAGVQLLPAVDYIRTDSRRTATTTAATPEENREYAAQWSMHAEEAMSLIVPEFVGNNSGDIFGVASGGPEWTSSTYWGRNQFKLNHEYIGLVLLVLAGLSFFGGRRRGLRWFMAGLFVVALGYTLGASSPIWQLMFATLPGISLFRAASMAIFLAGFAAITLATLGIDLILSWARGDAEPSRGARGWLIGATVAVGLVLVLASSGALYGIWEGLFGALDERRAGALALAKPFIARGAFFALLLTAATGAIAHLAGKRILQPVPILAALALLVAVDGMRIDRAFIQTRDFDDLVAPDPLLEELRRLGETEGPFRVFDFSDGSGESVRAAMFGIELTSGHHPNDMARYRELIGKEGGGQPLNLMRSGNVLRLTNTRYVIWPGWRFGDATQYAADFPALADLEAVTATQLQDGSLYEVLYAVETLPRARLVSDVEILDGPAAIDRILDPRFEVETTAILAEDPPFEIADGPAVGSVSWEERGTDGARLRVESDRAALLVIADNWVRAWSARVDGVKVPVVRTNYTQIGIPVGAGTHDVVLEFESGPVATGLWLSALSIILICVVAGVSRYRQHPPAPRPAEFGVPRD